MVGVSEVCMGLGEGVLEAEQGCEIVTGPVPVGHPGAVEGAGEQVRVVGVDLHLGTELCL